MHAMNEAPTPRASRVKDGYTTGARTLASRSVKSLARTRITPNALTAAGVTLCLTAAVLVPFESRDKLLFYWLGASVFVVGSVLAPWGGLQWAIYLLGATAWLTVLQRILHVRKQLIDGGTNVRS